MAMLARSNKTTIHKATIEIELKTKISFWDALKLRLSGSQGIKNLIEEKLRQVDNPHITSH